MSIYALVNLAAAAAAQALAGEATVDAIMACVPARYRQARSIADLPDSARASLTACAQRAAADLINASPPGQTDPRWRFERAAAVGGTLQYHYRFASDARGVPAGLQSQLAARARTDVCAMAPMREVISNGGAFEYIWLNRTGAMIGGVRIDRC